MAFRATITVVRASADPTYVALSANTTNVNAEAIAFVNPDSKNQWFYETTTLSDIQFSLVEKNLSETVTLDENVGWSYDKNAPETLALVESFAKVVSYNRTFTDAFTLDDLSQIDKDFYGNKGNVAFITDIIGLHYDKDFTNNNGYLNLDELNSGGLNYDGSSADRRVTVHDVITLAVDYIREFADSYSLSDTDYFNFGKNTTESLSITETSSKEVASAKTETITTADDSVLHPSLGKTETLSLTETYAKTLAKFITDAFTLDDSALIDKDFYGNKGNVVSFSDILAHGIAKNLTETTTLSDEHETTVNKAFSETLTFSETTVTNIVKTVTDAFTLDDSALIDKDYFGNKGNIIGLTEIVQQGLSKIEADIVTISELAEIGYTKPQTETISVADIRDVHPNLGKSETLSFSDTYIRNIMKGLSDAFALDDTAQINKDTDSTKGNVFGFSDVFSRTVSYDRDYSDSFGFSDTLSRTVSFVRAYSDSYSLDEVRDLHLSKTFADTFTVYDERPNALNVNMFNTQDLNSQDDAFLVDKGLGKSDALAFSEITAFNHDKGLGESLTFSDDYGLQLVKTLSDGFALDDSALVDKDYFGNKGNIVGVSDQVTVEYFYGGLLGQAPLNVVNLN